MYLFPKFAFILFYFIFWYHKHNSELVQARDLQLEAVYVSSIERSSRYCRPRFLGDFR